MAGSRWSTRTSSGMRHIAATFPISRSSARTDSSWHGVFWDSICRDGQCKHNMSERRDKQRCRCGETELSPAKAGPAYTPATWRRSNSNDRRCAWAGVHLQSGEGFDAVRLVARRRDNPGSALDLDGCIGLERGKKLLRRTVRLESEWCA